MSEGGTGPPRERRRAEQGFVRCVNHHVNDARATRCRICGVPIPHEEFGPRPPDDGGNRRWLLALLAVLVLLVLILVVVLVSRGGGGSSGAAGGSVPRPSPTARPSSTVLTTSSGSPSSGSPSRSSPSPSRRVLHQGDSGADVADVQRRLTALGYAVVADGRLGPQTMAAVVDFKKHHALGAAPDVDPRTWQALEAATPSPSP